MEAIILIDCYLVEARNFSFNPHQQPHLCSHNQQLQCEPESDPFVARAPLRIASSSTTHHCASRTPSSSHCPTLQQIRVNVVPAATPHNSTCFLHTNHWSQMQTPLVPSACSDLHPCKPLAEPISREKLHDSLTMGKEKTREMLMAMDGGDKEGRATSNSVVSALVGNSKFPSFKLLT